MEIKFIITMKRVFIKLLKVDFIGENFPKIIVIIYCNKFIF